MHHNLVCPVVAPTMPSQVICLYLGFQESYLPCIEKIVLLLIRVVYYIAKWRIHGNWVDYILKVHHGIINNNIDSLDKHVRKAV